MAVPSREAMSKYQEIVSATVGLKNAYSAIESLFAIGQRVYPAVTKQDLERLGLQDFESIPKSLEAVIGEARHQECMQYVNAALENAAKDMDDRVQRVQELLCPPQRDMLVFVQWLCDASAKTEDAEKLRLLALLLGACKQFQQGVSASDLKLEVFKSEEKSGIAVASSLDEDRWVGAADLISAIENGTDTVSD